MWREPPEPGFSQAPLSRQLSGQLFQSNPTSCGSFSHKTGSEKSGVDDLCAPLIRGVNLQRICRKVLPRTGQQKDSIDYKNVDQSVTRQITRCTSLATKACCCLWTAQVMLILAFLCIALLSRVDLPRLYIPQFLGT